MSEVFQIVIDRCRNLYMSSTAAASTKWCAKIQFT